MKAIKKISFVLILCLTAILLLFVSCSKEKKDLLINTKWKLVGFVDANTREIKIAEPTEDYCYVLTFKKHQKWEGMSSTNHMEGKYSVNFSRSQIKISMEEITLINEFPDGNTYIDALFEVSSFSIQENELKLYYNNKENYLLYKPKKQ